MNKKVFCFHGEETPPPKITGGGRFAYVQPLWVQLVLDIRDSETKADLFLLTGIRCVQLCSVSWNADSAIHSFNKAPTSQSA